MRPALSNIRLSATSVKKNLKVAGVIDRIRDKSLKPQVHLSSTAGVLYLSSNTTLTPAITLGSGLPSTINDLPMHYRCADAAIAVMNAAHRLVAPEGHTNHATGHKLFVTNKTIRHSINGNRTIDEIAVVAHLDKLTQKFGYAGSRPDKRSNPQVLRVHEYSGRVSMRGHTYVSVLIVKEFADGRRVHDHHFVWEIKMPAGTSVDTHLSAVLSAHSGHANRRHTAVKNQGICKISHGILSSLPPICLDPAIAKRWLIELANARDGGARWITYSGHRFQVFAEPVNIPDELDRVAGSLRPSDIE